MVKHTTDGTVAAYWEKELISMPKHLYRVGQSVKTIDLRDEDFFVPEGFDIEAAWVQNRQERAEGVVVKWMPAHNSLYVLVHPNEVEAVYYETELEEIAKTTVPEEIILLTQHKAYEMKDELIAQSEKVLAARKVYLDELNTMESKRKELTTVAKFLEEVSPDTLREGETWFDEFGLTPTTARWIEAHKEDLEKKSLKEWFSVAEPKLGECHLHTRCSGCSLEGDIPLAHGQNPTTDDAIKLFEEKGWTFVSWPLCPSCRKPA
jgi:hypothetical protein